MSFQSLNKDELTAVAEFFVVDVEVADAEKGATKKELLAALAAGDDPVTWDQYKEIYLKNAVELAPQAPKVEAQSAAVEEDEPEDEGNLVLVRYLRRNPTWEVVGYTFTKEHPFKSVPAEIAEYLVLKQEGFRLALPTEVSDYYN